MTDIGGIHSEHLRSFIERIERLEEEKAALAADIKDVYAEAKNSGFDVKIMRILVRLRKMEPTDLEEQETLLDVYKRALGMATNEPFGGTPLGEAAGVGEEGGEDETPERIVKAAKAAAAKPKAKPKAGGGRKRGSVEDAARNLVGLVRKHDATMTIATGGKSVTIGADPKSP